jgi:HNH endonuclease
MTLTSHENFANELLLSLSDNQPEIETLEFAPDPARRRNAARAMTAILCNRLTKKSGHKPTLDSNTTYNWKEGIFNCRNIADRHYLWTNIRRRFAEKMHAAARNKPMAYLLAFSNPSEMTLNVWAIPEPLLNDSLPSLPLKKSGEERSVQIFAEKQRIEKYAASPDLTPYFRTYPLSRRELLVLRDSREVDSLAKRDRATARGENAPNIKPDNNDVAAEFDASEMLARAAQQLMEVGFFDPAGISDARDRVFSSVVRCRGQPAFRRYLLAAYNGRCAITGCGLEHVLDAAHIIPYKGPETNHPTNGLLLRTDLHTLFDLRLVAVDVATMSLLVSPSLAGSCYEEYRGKSIKVPDDHSSRPSRAALEQHRKESGL